MPSSSQRPSGIAGVAFWSLKTLRISLLGGSKADPFFRGSKRDGLSWRAEPTRVQEPWCSEGCRSVPRSAAWSSLPVGLATRNGIAKEA